MGFQDLGNPMERGMDRAAAYGSMLTQLKAKSNMERIAQEMAYMQSMDELLAGKHGDITKIDMAPENAIAALNEIKQRMSSVPGYGRTAAGTDTFGNILGGRNHPPINQTYIDYLRRIGKPPPP